MTKLALFLYCHSLRGKNSQVRVLWEDQYVARSFFSQSNLHGASVSCCHAEDRSRVTHSRNDLFINGFGLFTSAAGAKIAWWMVSFDAETICGGCKCSNSDAPLPSGSRGRPRHLL